MPNPTPSTSIATSIVTEISHLKALELTLLAAGHQELANVVHLAYTEFQAQAVTGFLNNVNIDSRSIKGNI